MTKYLIAAIAVLALGLAGALWTAHALYQSNTAMEVSLNAEKDLRIAAQARTNAIQAQVQREKTRADLNRSLLRNALKDNEEWARGRTPAAVADSLCKHPAVCSPAAGTVR